MIIKFNNQSTHETNWLERQSTHDCYREYMKQSIISFQRLARKIVCCVLPFFLTFMILSRQKKIKERNVKTEIRIPVTKATKMTSEDQSKNAAM